jgi:exonuclease SbcD
MKILHTSDWHLGKKLEGFSRLEEQEAVLEEICGIAEQEKAHAIIVAGDLFDTYNPSSDAVEVFYRYLKKMADNGRRAVIALAGNHDSPNRQSSNIGPALIFYFTFLLFAQKKSKKRKGQPGFSATH